MTEAYEELKQKVAEKVELIQKHKEELNNLYAKCTHEESYTTVQTKCVVCDKVLQSVDR